MHTFECVSIQFRSVFQQSGQWKIKWMKTEAAWFTVKAVTETLAIWVHNWPNLRKLMLICCSHCYGWHCRASDRLHNQCCWYPHSGQINHGSTCCWSYLRTLHVHYPSDQTCRFRVKPTTRLIMVMAPRATPALFTRGQALTLVGVHT